MEDQVNNSQVSLSRRDLGRAAAATLAGALLAAATPGEGQTPSSPPAGSAESDPRVSLIEKSRGKPLTDEQKQAVLKNIRDTDEAWTTGRREFRVPDQTEPDFVFRPTSARRPPDARRRKDGPNG